jgi:hypothetical protein
VAIAALLVEAMWRSCIASGSRGLREHHHPRSDRCTVVAPAYADRLGPPRLAASITAVILRREVTTAVSTEAERVRAGSRLPSWFDANRVQGHTRLGLGKYEPPPRPPRYWYGTEEFNQAAAGFKELGAGAFTRHLKSGSEDPWWPTALPVDPDGVVHSDRPRDINGIVLQPGENVAKAIIDEAHAQGLKIIAYYWDASEKTVAELHDDWVCRRPQHGKELKSPRSIQLDLTGPYREVVRTRLLELAEMGADGFFFDSRHINRLGCWGTTLEAAWKAETGEDAPPLPKPGEEPSQRYLEFLDFRARKIEETFTYWRDEVKSRYRDVVFVISTDDFAALIDRGVTTRLAGIADSAKNEYCQAVHNKITRKLFEQNTVVLKQPPGHVRQSLSWTILRDSSEGRPPHIWHPGVPTEEQAEALAASLLTFGAIANMDVYERSLRQEDRRGKTPVAGLKRAFALGKLVSPHLARAQPLRWAAVHFGERSRNHRGVNYLAMWQQVLWPLVGPYKVLTENGLPIGVVNDEQLEEGELDGYSLLVLPNPNELTPGQADTVAAFTARQGTVIENNPAWAWSDPAASDAAAAAFRAVLRPYLATAPVQVTAGPAGRYAASYRKPGRLLVAVTNDFSWVQFSTLFKPIEQKDVNSPPPEATGVQVTWRAGQVQHPKPGHKPAPHRPHAIEVVSNRSLPVHQFSGGYRVELPDFQFMALLVVTALGPRSDHQEAPA